MSAACLTVLPFDEPKKTVLHLVPVYSWTPGEKGSTILEGHEMTAAVEAKENKREQWGGKAEFLLACLGNAVGLGNVWRFPYLAYKNGGGAFVIPYIIMVFLIGLPLFIVELSLGQFSAFGPAHLYSNIAPIFKGVGYASIVAAFIVSIYYNMIIAWTLYYCVESFLGQNWQYCEQPHNTDKCRTLLESTGNKTGSGYTSSSEEFFNNYILGKSSGIEEWGSIQWKLAVALLVAWIIVCVSLIKGIQSSGKVVYFTATFPYVILVLLFFRGITLPGALDGVHYYIVPEWSKIKDIQVWRDAAIQVFYSFGIAGGGMLTYASYNKFTDPILQHSLLIGFGDMLTSLFAGFVVFSMLGFMAHTLNTHISQVVQGGFGLAFIAIPDGLTQMPGSALWCGLYFFMLFLLGIDSQFAGIETITTYIFDTMRSSNRKPNKPLVVTLTCTIMFLCGLPFCTNAGIYILELVDNYAAGFPYLLIGLLETIIISYIYGIGNYLNDLTLMTGWRPPLWLKSHFVVMIATIAPIVITILLSMDLRELFYPESPFTSGTYVFPQWSNYIGWATAIIPIALIPIGSIHHLSQSKKDESLLQRFKSSFRATALYRSNAMRYSKVNNDSNIFEIMTDVADVEKFGVNNTGFEGDTTSDSIPPQIM